MNQNVATQPDEACADTLLVEAARNGDAQVFSDLYRQHARWLLPLLWRFTGGDNQLAEDLLQESFVRAWERLDQLTDAARFGGWLKTLAIHVALGQKRRFQVAGTDDGLATLGDIEPPWPASDMDLERAVTALPDRARQVLVLFCIEGHTHEEIAGLLAIEPGAFKAQLHRARSLLNQR